MKTILFILLLTTCISKAQVKIATAVDTSLYVAINNPVTIESATIPLQDLKLRTSNGVVTGSNGKYNITCSNTQKDVLLEVTHKNKVIASKKINVNRITDPVAYPLGEKLFTDSFITRKQISSIQSIVTNINYPLINFPVSDFTAEIIHNGFSTGTLHNEGSTLSEPIKALLKYATPGDRIVFSSIRVTDPGSSKKYVPSVALLVTE